MKKEVFEMPIPIGGTVWEKDFPALPQKVMGYCIGIEEFDSEVWYIQYGLGGIKTLAPISEIGVSIFLTRDEMMAAF